MSTNFTEKPSRKEGDRQFAALADAVAFPRPSDPDALIKVTRSAANRGADADLRRRLRQLSADQLVELLLVFAAGRDADLLAVLRQAPKRAANPSGAEASTAGEPYMVGASSAMQDVYAAIRKFAASNAPVLVTGESGTGKELVAQAIHERSAYASGPFVAINCGALPPTLIAAELFGYEKGAFTGAVQRRIGRLESARGGTIFLDEIGDLPLELQGHLLRFMQEHTIDRVGGTRPITVDARVIVATNVDLAQAIANGKFREDLFYRLNILNMRLPALRERGDDIDLLAMFFLRKFAAEHDRTISGFSDDAMRMMREHSWPGNVRELIGCIRRAVVMADSTCITPRDLALAPITSAAQALSPPLDIVSCQKVDESRLRAALATNGGNVSHAARTLGVSRMTIYRLMQRFDLQP